MVDAKHCQQRDPKKPSYPPLEAEEENNRKKAAWDPAVETSEQRIRHMAAVELADREQIEERHEQSEPTGKGDRVQFDIDAISGDTKDEARQQGEQKRVSQEQAALEWIQRTHFREC